MNCPNCNEIVRDVERFCRYCGATLNAEKQVAPVPPPPESVAQVATPAPVEPLKAEPLKAVCPSCGANITAGMKFCRKCGGALVVAEPVPPPAPAYAPVQAKAAYAAPAVGVAEKPVAPQTTGVKVYKAQKGQLIVGIIFMVLGLPLLAVFGLGLLLVIPAILALRLYFATIEVDGNRLRYYIRTNLKRDIAWNEYLITPMGNRVMRFQHPQTGENFKLTFPVSNTEFAELNAMLLTNKAMAAPAGVTSAAAHAQTVTPVGTNAEAMAVEAGKKALKAATIELIIDMTIVGIIFARLTNQITKQKMYTAESLTPEGFVNEPLEKARKIKKLDWIVWGIELAVLIIILAATGNLF